MTMIHVAVGVIRNQQRVLLSRRQQGVHLEGYWEFPGGKLDADESPESALRRELREELGIEIKQYHPLITIPFDYRTHEVRLHVYEINDFDGEPHGREGQHVQWVEIAALQPQSLPPANRGIVSALRLPDRYLITPEPLQGKAAFLTHLQQCLENGVRLLQLRAKSLSLEVYRTLAMELMHVVQDYADVSVLFNGHIDLVQELGAHGVHLTSAQCRALDSRPLPEGYLVAASCHDAEEIKQACRIGADFIVLSPLRETLSHPGGSVLGWQAFSHLTDLSSVPVYALGGMTVNDIEQVRLSGGQGIAAITGLWNK